MTKKFLTLLMSLCMMLAILPTVALAAVDTPTSGTCGDGLTWTYTPNPDEYGDDLGGILVISGTGTMENYTAYNAPWSNFSYNINEIQIENGVTNIGEFAFYACRNLTNVTIPNSVTNIGRDAFGYCTSLMSVTVPDSVSSIGESAFLSCENLSNVVISDGIRTIGRHAFAYCSSLADISVPASVYRIECMFEGCDNMTAINVDSQNTEYSSWDGVLFNKERSELVCCPAGKSSFSIPTGVTTIDDYAFSGYGYTGAVGNSRLTGVIIPDTVTSIGRSAFSLCSALESVFIPDSVTSIGYDAFSDCTALTDVTLSKSVKGYLQYAYAFSGCTSLTSVTVPEGITNLDGTFYGCTNLTSIFLPSSLEEIRDDTFKDCSRLQTITYAGTETQWGLVEISQTGNQEISLAVLVCTGTGSPSEPDNPDAVDPDTLPLTVTNGGLGKRVSLQIEGGHWLTIQVRRAGSIAITSVQAPGAGTVTMSFSAPVGSVLQVWETEAEMTFTNGIPNNPILSTAVRQL